jgi:hypothetical protein
MVTKNSLWGTCVCFPLEVECDTKQTDGVLFSAFGLSLPTTFSRKRLFVLGEQLAKAEICAGVCGFNTKVETQKGNSGEIRVTIESECEAINRLAEDLTEVDPFREFTYRGEGPLTFEAAAKHCSHAACPVPVGIIKAVEIEAGLALPEDVSIRLSKSDTD